MTAVLLDTHAWAWSLVGDARLPARALAAMNQADRVLVSPISFFEIAQKVRLGKWPEMAFFIDRLPSLLQEQGGAVASSVHSSSSSGLLPNGLSACPTLLTQIGTSRSAGLGRRVRTCSISGYEQQGGNKSGSTISSWLENVDPVKSYSGFRRIMPLFQR